MFRGKETIIENTSKYTPLAYPILGLNEEVREINQQCKIFYLFL